MQQKIPSLEPKEELYCYDQPILFTAEVFGQDRLVTLIAQDGDNQIWMISSPTYEQIQAVMNNELPLRDASETGPFWRAVMPADDGPILAEQVSSWPEGSLPDPGVLLRLES